MLLAEEAALLLYDYSLSPSTVSNLFFFNGSGTIIKVQRTGLDRELASVTDGGQVGHFLIFLQPFGTDGLNLSRICQEYLQPGFSQCRRSEELVERGGGVFQFFFLSLRGGLEPREAVAKSALILQAGLW